MDPREKALVLRSIEAWRTASRFLEDERRERLRSMTDDDVRKAAIDLLTLPYADLPERGSGLIEQQRLFQRLR